jgi:hypothetical protein
VTYRRSKSSGISIDDIIREPKAPGFAIAIGAHWQTGSTFSTFIPIKRALLSIGSGSSALDDFGAKELRASRRHGETVAHR